MEEFNFALNLSRLSLCLVGIWPNLSCSRFFWITSNFLFFISIATIFNFILIPQTTKIFLIRNDFDTLVDILCVALIPITVAYFKMVRLRYDAQALKSLLFQMMEDWRRPRSNEQFETMRKSALLGRRVAGTVVGIAYGTSNVFLVLRLILRQQRQRSTGERDFLFESYFPDSLMATPWFEIVWLMQGMTTFLATTAFSGVDGFFGVLVLHLCGQLTILQDDLGELSLRKDGGSVHEDIVRIVERHNELNRFVQTIEKTFNKIFLAQIVACIVQLCLQGYQLISILLDETVELPILQIIFMIMFIIYMSLDLYIYCYVGEKLREKSLILSHAVFNCKWYNLKPNEVNDLLLIMKRAQHPLEITAGKFCSLSLSLFGYICKTSLGYLSMLLAIKEKNS